jgi:hypothetical protein
VNVSDTGTIVRARATLRTTLRLLRLELRLPRLFADLLFLAAKATADYAELARQNQDRTADQIRQMERWNIRVLVKSADYSIKALLHARPM